QLGQDGAVRAEPAPDGFSKDGAKVLFVFAVGAVTDSVGRVEIPILADRLLPCSYEYRRGRRNRVNPDVGGQMCGREGGEPARDILFLELERLSCEQDERIEDGAPGDLVFFD